MAMRALLPDLYAYFSGPWVFSRTMLGTDQAVLGQADGTAEFLPASIPYCLHYKESGRLHLSTGQRPVSFSRRFDYRIDGDMVCVDFADGVQAGEAYQRYRYDAAAQALLPVATHLCILDRYDGRYHLIGTDRFDLQTRIEGPHKDYWLHTHFTRAAE
jgi:hypothetical protein